MIFSERVGQKKEKDRSNDNLDDRQTQRPARDQNDAEPDRCTKKKKKKKKQRKKKRTG